MNIAQPAQAARLFRIGALVPSSAHFRREEAARARWRRSTRRSSPRAATRFWYRDGAGARHARRPLRHDRGDPVAGPAPARGGGRGGARARRSCSPRSSSTTWTRPCARSASAIMSSASMSGGWWARSAAGSPPSARAAMRVRWPRRCGATSSTIRRRPDAALAFVAGPAGAVRGGAGRDADRGSGLDPGWSSPHQVSNQ